MPSVLSYVRNVLNGSQLATTVKAPTSTACPTGSSTTQSSRTTCALSSQIFISAYYAHNSSALHLACRTRQLSRAISTRRTTSFFKAQTGRLRPTQEVSRALPSLQPTRRQLFKTLTHPRRADALGQPTPSATCNTRTGPVPSLRIPIVIGSSSAIANSVARPRGLRVLVLR